jgi:hypothetical protein
MLFGRGSNDLPSRRLSNCCRRNIERLPSMPDCIITHHSSVHSLAFALIEFIAGKLRQNCWPIGASADKLGWIGQVVYCDVFPGRLCTIRRFFNLADGVEGIEPGWPASWRLLLSAPAQATLLSKAECLHIVILSLMNSSKSQTAA